MKKQILFFALAVLAFSFSSCEKEIGHSSDCSSTGTPGHPRSAEYQAILDQYTNSGLPGISALIRDKYGVWTGASGFADISQEIPMRSCTVSKAASITKTFIGALVLKLAEEGKLNLDDHTGSGNGYGGVYSTVFDLQTFIEALVREKSVLSQDYLNQMLTFTDSVETYSRANGLGIFRDFLERAPDEYAWGHRGRDLGYTADMYWFPEKDITMVYLINYGTDAESGLKKQFKSFRNAMVDALMQE